MAALNDLLVCLLACCLVASAIACGELQRWPTWAMVWVYALAGLMASELAAAPMMWTLLGRRCNVVESLAMAAALGGGLYIICRFVLRIEEEITADVAAD